MPADTQPNKEYKKWMIKLKKLLIRHQKEKR